MAKANTSQEPSMEEILASIRRIISDETPAAGAAPAAKPAAPQPKAAKPAPEPDTLPDDAGEVISEEDLDKLFSEEDDSDEPVLELAADDDEEVLELVESEPEPSSANDDPLELVEGLMPDEADVSFVDPSSEPEEAPGPAELDMAEVDMADLDTAELDMPGMADDDAFSMDVEPEPEPPMAPPPRQRPQPAPSAMAADDLDEPAEPLVSRQTGASVNAAFGSLTHTILSNNAKTLDDLVKEMLRPMLKSWLDENLPGIVERLVRAEIERVSRGR